MGERRRILLVDDDRQVLFVLQAALRRLNALCDVATAGDGHAAFRLLEASAFDLLVTDIRLPGLDGLTLTEIVRARGSPMPVIWITAYGCRTLHEDAVRLRVYRCLEKPVEVDAFRQIVQQALAAPPSEVADGSEAQPAGSTRETGL